MGKFGTLTGLRYLMYAPCSNLFIGNLCRYCREREPPRSSRVDQCGAVQLGEVLWA